MEKELYSTNGALPGDPQIEIESKTSLSWEKFAPMFGTWADKVYPFFMKGGFDPIYTTLKRYSKEGRNIFPKHEDTYKALRLTPIDKVNCVVMGLCPYHTVIEENGKKIMVADGIPMSCGNHSEYQAPSLQNLYTAWEKEFEDGICLPCKRPQSLQYLCEQGVLLINAAWTVEEKKPGSHVPIWHPFTKYLFEEFIATSGVPVILLGNEAHKYARYLAPMQWTFEISHPASAAYKGTEWSSEGVFKKVNEIIYNTNKQMIQWLGLP